MVGVRERVVNNFPSLIVGEFLLVNQDSQQLNRRDCWMSVVQLNLVEASEFRPVILVVFLEASNNVTNGG